MKNKIDFELLNATCETLAPLIRANGLSTDNISKYVYYLLIIAAAFANHIGINVEQFKGLCASAFDVGANDLKKKYKSVN